MLENRSDPDEERESSDKVYLDKDVHTMALERMDYILDTFEQVYISVSGGKDSSIMLQLFLERAELKDKLPVKVLFIDLEAQYSATIKHVEELILTDKIEAYWICLPFKLRNAVSIYEPHWICWQEEAKEKWVREMPTHECVINTHNMPPEWKKWVYVGMEFEEFIIPFGMWMRGRKNQQLTATGIGIRSDESLNRFLALRKTREESTHKGVPWTTMVRKNLVNFYPIYDWKTQDIWTAVGKFGYKYNKIYDLMYLTGRSIHDSRICQPYGDDQREGLDLFRKIEPETWAKVVERVSGANLGNIYRGTTLLAHRKVMRPDHFKTWKEYGNFLLNTIPKYQAHIYKERFEQFLHWWETEGNWPRDEVPDSTPPKSDPRWKLPDGTTHRKLPSWERIAKAILKNDINCRTLSFGSVVGGYPRYLKLKEMYGE